MTDSMKLTERHVIEKAGEILAEARRLGYYMFKCHLLLSGSNPIKLSFANAGSIWYVRQLGWAQFLEKSGGRFTGIDQGLHFKDVVQSLILSSDGIEPWRRGVAGRRQKQHR